MMGDKLVDKAEKRRLVASTSRKDDDEIEETFSVGEKKYVVTRRRWGVMAIVCSILFLDIWGVMFFAFVHDVTSAYFRTNPSVTDLVSTINLVARGLLSLVVAMLSDNLNFRTSTMGTAGIIFSGSLLVSVGISSRNNFPILILGQVIGGFSAAIAITLGQMATANWFPKREHGKTVAGPLLTRRLSLVASNLVSTHSLGSSLYELKNMQLDNFTTTHSRMDSLMKNVGTTYSMVYIGVAAVAFISFCLAHLFVYDHPPLVNGCENPVAPKRFWNPVKELKALGDVFKNKLFLLLLLHFTLFLSIRPLTDALLSSIVLRAFPNLTDQFAGTMFCVSLTLGGFGSTFGGALLDRFRKPRCTYMGGVLFTSMGCCIFSLSFYILSKVLMYIGYIMLVFSRDVMLVCLCLALVQSVTNETQSRKVRVFSIAGSLPWVSPSAYTYFIRKVMERFGPSVAVLFPIPFLVLSGCLWMCHNRYFIEATKPRT